MNDDQIIETGTKPNKAKQELNRNIHLTDIGPPPRRCVPRHNSTIGEGGAPQAGAPQAGPGQGHRGGLQGRSGRPGSHGGSGDSWDYGGSGDFGESKWIRLCGLGSWPGHYDHDYMPPPPRKSIVGVN